jgi:hypothetical protein
MTREINIDFDSSLAATSIGSFPHRETETACDLVLENFLEIPIWPQLPAVSLNEQMDIQFSEGLPRAVIDSHKERMYIDTSGDPTAVLERFYENYLTENLDYFAISNDFARGIRGIEEHFSRMKRNGMKYFKMQVTGPISFGLSIVDENRRAIYYNDVFRDVIVKCMAMKARWQLRRFQPLCERRICIMDEPILSAFGSSTYVGVQRDEVVFHINEMVKAIHAEHGLAGIHCCGNTEWSIPIDAGVDIISFDAYGYGDSITLYPDAMRAFLGKGGILAWGIVPTSAEIDQHTVSSLIDRFEILVDDMSSKGIDRDLILRNALITASCGTGTVPVDRAERIARTTRLVSDQLKERYSRRLDI